MTALSEQLPLCKYFIQKNSGNFEADPYQNTLITRYKRMDIILIV